VKLAIVKYNAGNIQSVIYALNRLGIDPILTDNPEELASADKILFPGVGEAQSAMTYLRNAGLDKVLTNLHQPFLGICIGQQLMCKHSEEGDTECLGIFPIEVKKFPKEDKVGNLYKVPHMGWNKLKGLNSPLFEGVNSDHAYVYYVHSYYCEQSEFTTATSEYSLEYSAALHKDNYHSVQFHPEKSGDVGHKILENFLKL
jgi:glutamine amidotransferase